MRLSTRSRYSTRLILELAKKYDQGPIYLKDISNSQEISLKYLGQLIIPLKIAGLIKSTRGAHGGYFLSKAPDKIRLSDIVVAVEGPLFLLECLENSDICNRSDICEVREFWKVINDKFYRSLEDITIKDILDRSKS